VAPIASRAPTFVLVAGPPGSGKTTLAGPLARELGLPLIAKDAIKEALMATLGAPATVVESRRLGGAAVMAMLAVARTSPGAVLDSTFYPYAVPHLTALPGPLVEIRCLCPRELARERYRVRAAERHPGHLDAERADDELWDEQHLRPLGLGPLIEVDTSCDVDVRALARRVEAAARS
jgi:predicted kinase